MRASGDEHEGFGMCVISSLLCVLLSILSRWCCFSGNPNSIVGVTGALESRLILCSVLISLCIVSNVVVLLGSSFSLSLLLTGLFENVDLIRVLPLLSGDKSDEGV